MLTGSAHNNWTIDSKRVFDWQRAKIDPRPFQKFSKGDSGSQPEKRTFERESSESAT